MNPIYLGILLIVVLCNLISPAHATELSVGGGCGQNDVNMVSIQISQPIHKNLFGTFQIAHHGNDGAVDIFSFGLEARQSFGSIYLMAFAGLGYGKAHGYPQDIAVSTIGHWGGGIGYKNFQLRVSHWSNPFEHDEYGHNVLSLHWEIKLGRHNE